MPAPVIDYVECLKDSPRFRQQLGINESSLDDLEAKVDKILKCCNTLTEGGKAYMGHQAAFLDSVWDLSSYFSTEQDTTITSNLNQLIQTLQDVLKLQNVMIDQTDRAINKSLSKFIKEDIKKMRETKGYFNKISNDLDSALNKNASASKSRPAEVEDASNLLTATKSCFRYTGMDYVYQISMLQSKKRHVTLEAIGNLVKAFDSYFKQGMSLFNQTETFIKTMDNKVQEMEASTAALEKSLEKRHTYVTKDDTDILATDGVGRSTNLEGYLFKRGHGTFRSWNRRWFYLDSNKLCYAKRNGEDKTVMEENLRICMVRPLNEIDRRFCFEMISPVKSHVLQADSEDLYTLWMTKLQQGISSALHQVLEDGDEDQWSEDSDTEEAQDQKVGRLTDKSSKGAAQTIRSNALQILDIPGNEVCCDCRNSDPQWASINYGVTLCIECGGIHRSLGVHITKVRSIKLDVWEPEILKVMAELGNNIVNKILEAKVKSQDKPGPNATRAQREAFIINKYKEKTWVDKDVFSSQEVREHQQWSVRRLRRRARSSKPVRGRSKSSSQDRDPKIKDDDESLLESVLRVSTLSSSSSRALSTSCSNRMSATSSGRLSANLNIDDKEEFEQMEKEMSNEVKVLNSEIVLFGGSLAKHDVASVQLDSDQESTDEETDTSSNTQITDSMLDLHPDLLLYRGAGAHNLPVMLMALALGADPEWKHNGEGMQTAIHQAVRSGSVMSTQFLILNNTPTGSSDGDGNSGLHVAAMLRNTGQVCLLLKHRANHHLLNRANQNPLDIAVANSDADIVTLLRLAALNEEIRENDLTGDDDTFNDVVQEFSNMVYTHPERLNRNKK